MDYFDALTMDRPHRKALPSDDVLHMLKAESGAHFDPAVVEAFLDSFAKIGDIQAQFR